MVGIWGENTGKFELGCGKKKLAAIPADNVSPYLDQN